MFRFTTRKTLKRARKKMKTKDQIKKKIINSLIEEDDFDDKKSSERKKKIKIS